MGASLSRFCCGCRCKSTEDPRDERKSTQDSSFTSLGHDHESSSKRKSTASFDKLDAEQMPENSYDSEETVPKRSDWLGSDEALGVDSVQITLHQQTAFSSRQGGEGESVPTTSDPRTAHLHDDCGRDHQQSFTYNTNTQAMFRSAGDTDVKIFGSVVNMVQGTFTGNPSVPDERSGPLSREEISINLFYLPS